MEKIMSSVKNLEFYFDFGSPASYLAWTQLPKIAEENNANLIMIPMLLGGVFKATGNNSPATIASKGKWMNKDLKRHADMYGVKFVLNEFFPINTLYLMRGALAAKKLEIFYKYVEGIYLGIWVKNLNLGDTDILKNYLEELKINSDRLFELSQNDEVKNELIKNTEEAVKRGVFGAPSIFVGEEMHFGQDRLNFVEKALKL